MNFNIQTKISIGHNEFIISEWTCWFKIVNAFKDELMF